MPSGFPNSIDSFTNPLASSPLNSPSHAGQHQDLNDAVNKIETYMGLVLVTKSTATGTSASLNINNCFTSLYSNYRIIVAIDPSPTSLHQFTMRMRVGGVDTSTSIYGSIQQWFTGASNGIDRFNSSSAWSIMRLGLAGKAGAIIDITAPQLAKRTSYTGQAFDITNSADYFSASIFGLIDNTVAYDGFTLFSTGNITGVVSVYGYRQ